MPDPIRTVPYGWEAFFGSGGPPQADSTQVCSPILRLPKDGSEVDEESSQLLVFDQICADVNQTPGLAVRLRRVLIDGFDPVIAGLVNVELDGRYTVLYRHAGWARFNAQVIWKRVVQAGRLEAMRYTAFLPEKGERIWTYGAKYDLIYLWIPFADYVDVATCDTAIAALAHALAPGGVTFVAGPSCVKALLPMHELRLLCDGGREDLRRLPAMVEHCRTYPNTNVNPQLSVVLGKKENGV